MLGKASPGCLERWVTWGRDSETAFGRDIYATAPGTGRVSPAVRWGKSVDGRGSRQGEGLEAGKAGCLGKTRGRARDNGRVTLLLAGVGDAPGQGAD